MIDRVISQHFANKNSVDYIFGKCERFCECEPPIRPSAGLYSLLHHFYDLAIPADHIADVITISAIISCKTQQTTGSSRPASGHVVIEIDVQQSNFPADQQITAIEPKKERNVGIAKNQYPLGNSFDRGDLKNLLHDPAIQRCIPPADPKTFAVGPMKDRVSEQCLGFYYHSLAALKMTERSSFTAVYDKIMW